MHCINVLVLVLSKAICAATASLRWDIKGGSQAVGSKCTSSAGFSSHQQMWQCKEGELCCLSLNIATQLWR